MRNTTTSATRRIPALIALGILLTLAAALSLIGAVPAAAPAAVSAAVPAQATVDYDSDNDNLIEIASHAQLNVIRHDLDGNGSPGAGATAYNTAFPNAASGMGCASTCIGYELTVNIDLDTDGDGSPDSGDAYYNSGSGWVPIGGFPVSERYTAVFNGNGHTITNLYIARATNTLPTGLFTFVGAGARIESLGITSAGVTGNNYVGALAGYNVGEIVAVYTTGSVTASNGSYAGGLVGQQTASGTIHSSYSTASVTGQANVGGLVGQAAAGTGASITNSYSTGQVSRSSGTATTIGGLIGAVAMGFTASASYFDSTTSGCVSGGSNGCTTSAAGTTQTTSALQSPTGYTGIYAAWNANIDGVTGADDPWDFAGSSAYPALIYHLTDYDSDEDNYIEVSTLAQLNVIRHDLDGNGAPASGQETAYAAAFPNRVTSTTKRMGCPGTCAGYELTANLDFDENGDGQITSADSTYWNGGAGWQPIGTQSNGWATNFKGNGHTIDNLFINRSSSYIGLFGNNVTNGTIESLGVTNANVSGSHGSGVLSGGNEGGAIVACYTTGAVSGAQYTGGLAGYSTGSVAASYSHASVSGTASVGGLLGQQTGSSVGYSYSTGAVSGTGANVSGLIGTSSSSPTITASYWDTQTSNRASSNGGSGQTTSALKTPTGYTGIYSTWSANLDGVAGNDAPWAFGTSSDYPTLVYHLTVDYDEDNDRLIDVANLAQLNAMRYDRNGNGANEASGQYSVSVSNWAIHSSAFPRRVAGMGCPGGCRGYELVADLDFDTNGDGSVTTAGDDYWNGGAGWDAIGGIGSTSSWRTTFRGNGHTINNLFINSTGNDKGLFGATGAGGRIESVGVTNANINPTVGVPGDYVGILLSTNGGNGLVVACYATGKIRGDEYVGGLVAYNESRIQSSYSTAHVTGRHIVGGLLAHQHQSGPRLYNSYSTGRVVRSQPSSSTSIGGLVGNLGGSATAANTVNSYYDISTSGCVTGGSDGCTRSLGGTGKTTRELQTVTDFTGIYANWNTQPGSAWTFGNNMQYPMLTYQGMTTDPQGGQAMGTADGWNEPVVGERVGVCLTPDDFPDRAVVDGETYYVGWVWERSADGVDWSDAVPLNNMGMPSGDPPAYNSPPTYEYIPTSDDVGKYLRAKMELSDGSTAYTRNLGGRVVASSGVTPDAPKIAFVSGHIGPQVGTEIIASNPLPDGAVDARVGWQRCPYSTPTVCTTIIGTPGVWWTRYTPTYADVGSYLRMYAYYATSDGTWTRRETYITTGVVASP